MLPIERLRQRLAGEECPDELLEDLLKSAESIILERRYPYGAGEGLEPRYRELQLRIAVELYDRMGAEGQTSHTENGISRTWASGDVSPGLLSAITPKVGVP